MPGTRRVDNDQILYWEGIFKFVFVLVLVLVLVFCLLSFIF